MHSSICSAPFYTPPLDEIATMWRVNLGNPNQNQNAAVPVSINKITEHFSLAFYFYILSDEGPILPSSYSSCSSMTIISII